MNTIPKSFEPLIKRGAIVKPITYKSNGIKIKRKGFDVIILGNPQHTTIRLEPKSYRKESVYAKDKWLMACNGHVRYLRSLRGIDRQIQDFVIFAMNH